jgi:cytidyltransferase-like protein
MERHPFKHILLGGTVDGFHAGHQEFIDWAHRLAGRVTFFLNSDEYAQGRKSYDVKPFGERKAAILNYLEERGWQDRCEVLECHSDQEVELFLSDETFDAMLTLEENLEVRLLVNESREKKYAIIVKPRTAAADGSDLSSTKLRASVLAASS